MNLTLIPTPSRDLQPRLRRALLDISELINDELGASSNTGAASAALRKYAIDHHMRRVDVFNIHRLIQSMGVHNVIWRATNVSISANSLLDTD